MSDNNASILAAAAQQVLDTDPEDAHLVAVYKAEERKCDLVELQRLERYGREVAHPTLMVALHTALGSKRTAVLLRELGSRILDDRKLRPLLVAVGVRARDAPRSLHRDSWISGHLAPVVAAIAEAAKNLTPPPPIPADTTLFT